MILFPLDVTAVYTNIDPEVGISSIKELLERTMDLPNDLPTTPILEALRRGHE
jgi:hypothetical protein